MRQSSWLAFIFLICLGSVALSQSEIESSEVLAGKVFDPQADYEIHLSAQGKTYPGGIDEDELQVQSNLSEPIRKVGPNADPQSTRPIQ